MEILDQGILYHFKTIWKCGYVKIDVQTTNKLKIMLIEYTKTIRVMTLKSHDFWSPWKKNKSYDGITQAAVDIIKADYLRNGLPNSSNGNNTLFMWLILFITCDISYFLV